MDKSRVVDQKTIDKAIVAAVKKQNMLESYLRSSFSLRHGQRPHEMVF
jgi:large subunit ribosomal protein L6e